MIQANPPSIRTYLRKRFMTAVKCGSAALLLAGTVIILPSCDNAGTASVAEPPATIEDVLTIGEKLVLEEPEGVINVWPMVRKDPRGGFLIADMREGAIRRYSDDGKLQFSIGRTGDGPEEFRSPSVALRLPTGEILALAMNGKAAIIDSGGERVLRTARLPVSAIEDAEALNDSIVVVAGVLAQEPVGARLHLWNFRRDTILASFFVPTVGNDIRDAAAVARWTNIAVRADTIAAAFAPLDTIYLLSGNGGQIAKIPLGSKFFRLASAAPEAIRRDRRARTEWVGSFHLVSGLEWVPGGFLIQYQGFENMTPYFNIMRVSRSGELLFDVTNAPRFLVLLDSDEAFFVDPNAETPNQWIAATLH